MILQSLIRAIYPPQCVGCDAPTEEENGLCAECWKQTTFVHGAQCDKCGVPLPGEDGGDRLICDDCLRIARPWSRGRASMVYAGKGRALVMALKHGDRTELALPAARWMLRQIPELVTDTTILVPIPLHRFRLIKRRYNQAALLSGAMAEVLDLPHCPDALLRPSATKPLEGHNRAARFEALKGKIVPNPRRTALIKGRDVVLVDDVMTTGATFAAGTEALMAMGAQTVCVLALARVAKDA